MRSTITQRRAAKAAATRAPKGEAKGEAKGASQRGRKGASQGKSKGASKGASQQMTSKASTNVDVAAVEADARAQLPRFPIVGIGASVGGLDAFVQLLAHVPANTGMAFILVQHLDPEQPSFLSEHVRRATAMPVLEVRDGLSLKPNHVYVAPPACEVALHGTKLAVKLLSTRRAHLPIDAFFRSLADAARSKAIGVVLSGMGHDGTLGLRAIEAESGVTLVQDPTTARYGSMPHSAEADGTADFVLPLPALAAELVRLARHPFVRGDDVNPFAGPLEAATLKEALELVRKAAGVDFTEYKDSTVRRRIARRVALRQKATLADYVALLRTDPAELRALFDDALVNVTSFFREPAMFEELKLRVFPAIMKHKEPGAPVRVWVAGCSTGEEVYSIAMAFLEYQADARISVPLQVFGSDVSDRVIEKARSGVYSDSAMQDVGVERTRRFFVKIDGGFRVSKTVRDLCVFVRHDLARDPPFSKLDLATCRNVLIYFGAALQKRVIATMHYCLLPPGFLVLGHTENASAHAHLFTLVDKTNKIFARNAVMSSLRFPHTHEPGVMRAQIGGRAPSSNEAHAGTAVAAATVDLPKHGDNLLLAHYAPAGVIVNESLDILQFRGRTGPYLEPAPGAPQNNLLKMAREGMLADLRVAMSRVKKENAFVRREDVSVKLPGGSWTRCNIVVFPVLGLPEQNERLFVVLFEDPEQAAAVALAAGAVSKSTSKSAAEGRSKLATKGKGKGGKNATASSSLRSSRAENSALSALEEELKATKDYLQSVADDHQRTNDQLTSANEELVSSNEELQSMNEELETAKEELQSVNEELTTVNDELHNRNRDMNQLNNDLSNILASVEIPLVILDSGRRIRRFTPKARALMSLVPADVGRPIDDIRLNVKLDEIDKVVADVIDNMAIFQREVQDREGRWHRIQIRPYKTSENTIDGALLSLVDVDDLKKALARAEQAKEEAEHANNAKDQFLSSVSHELRMPLSSLLMQAQVIRAGTLTADEVRVAADAIELATRVQVKLVDDLLDASRMVAGRVAIERAPVNLAAVVRTAVSGAAPLANGKSVAVDVHIAQPGVHVSGDFGRLQQVAWNLLANAVKYSDPGARVAVSLTAKDGHAELRVVDDGAGIEPELLPFVFTRFAKTDDGRGSAQGSLGLGLAIARHIVEMHGGTVRAESGGSGRGTTMVVQLPLLIVAT